MKLNEHLKPPAALQRAASAVLMPPGFVVACGIVATIALMAWLFLGGNAPDSGSPLAVTSYCICAYGAVITCIYLARLHPIRHIDALAHRSRHIGRLIDDAEHRAHTFICLSCAINVLWACANAALGLWYASAWFVSLAVWYLLLAVMRALLIRSARSTAHNVHVTLRICGIMLMAIMLALSGVVLLVMKREGGFSYPGYTIYLVALYAFYTLAVSIVNFARRHRSTNPLRHGETSINLAVALVSMFSLQIAMYSSFGTGSDAALQFQMIAATGAVVCCIVLVLGLLLVVRSTQKLHRKRERIERE